MMESLDDETLKDEEILKINKLLSSLEKNEGGNIEELKSVVTDDPNNKEKRFELAEKYLSLNETELGFNELLIIFEKDPKWNDEAAKKKLLEFFDLLGFNDPNVLEARKRLSSLMFK
jgi:putative thioredoxin